MIWKFPIYRFLIPVGQNRLKELFIDVTHSAPAFGVGKELAGTFDWALGFVGGNNATILDFGAGKLRNTLHLLGRGNEVTAVEFKKLSEESEQGKQSLLQAQQYGTRFKRLIFPHEFFSSDQKFNLIILVNILGIMPVPAERSLVLTYCKEKLSEDGLMLLFSQTTQSFYKDKFVPENELGDGYVVNTDDKYKTFYKDFEIDEIDELFAATGMRLKEKKIVPHVEARLYKSVGRNPLVEILTASRIRDAVKGDRNYSPPRQVTPRMLNASSNRLNEPDPEQLSPVELYKKALPRIRIGNQYASTYQNLIGAIFLRLFSPALTNIEFERPIDGGSGKIDIVLRNHADDGFFDDLTESYGIKCPYVFIECKNISTDLGNGEFSQIEDRLGDLRSRFGIIVCRKNQDRQAVLQQAKRVRREEDKMVIWLEDDDVLGLLDSSDNSRRMNDILENRVEEIELS